VSPPASHKDRWPLQVIRRPWLVAVSKPPRVPHLHAGRTQSAQRISPTSSWFPMKYRVEIYDLAYKIIAKSEEGAVRAALARYARTASAERRHCMLARLARGSTYCDDRDWDLSKAGRHYVGRWVKCRYLIGVTPMIVHRLVDEPAERAAEPAS
jgi:hypothetical protein